MLNSVKRIVDGIGMFFLWCSRFGVNGDEESRGLNAVLVTSILLAGFLFTLTNVLFFYVMGGGFLSWYDASISCPSSASFLCRHNWIVPFVIFFLPSYVFSRYIRRRYFHLVGPRASGVDYLFSFVIFFGMWSVLFLNFNRVLASVSLLIQLLFFIFLVAKAKRGFGPGGEKKK